MDMHCSEHAVAVPIEMPYPEPTPEQMYKILKKDLFVSTLSPEAKCQAWARLHAFIHDNQQFVEKFCAVLRYRIKSGAVPNALLWAFTGADALPRVREVAEEELADHGFPTQDIVGFGLNTPRFFNLPRRDRI